MENAADALQMAAAVLIFVLALSISINAFGEARQTSQIMVQYNDREYNYTYVEDNGSTERIVSLESIIPTVYKSYSENYKVIFDSSIVGSSSSDGGVYRRRNNDTGQTEPVYQVDLNTDAQSWALGSHEQIEQFIMAILYGQKYEDFSTIENTLQNRGIYLNNRGLYDKIKDSRVKESIGIYYIGEEGLFGEDASNVPETNKTEKRVITYTPI